MLVAICLWVMNYDSGRFWVLIEIGIGVCSFLFNVVISMVYFWVIEIKSSDLRRILIKI